MLGFRGDLCMGPLARQPYSRNSIPVGDPVIETSSGMPSSLPDCMQGQGSGDSGRSGWNWPWTFW